MRVWGLAWANGGACRCPRSLCLTLVCSHQRLAQRLERVTCSAQLCAVAEEGLAERRPGRRPRLGRHCVHQRGRGGCGEKRPDSGMVLKVRQTEFAAGLDVSRVMKRRAKGDPTVWEDGIATSTYRSTLRSTFERRNQRLD